MTSFLGRFYGDDPVVVPVTPPEEKKFTQDDVNKMLAENKRNLQKQVDELKKAGDATALQAKIKELSNTLLTKEELAKQEADSLRNTFESQIKQTADEKVAWENRYKDTLFKVELQKGASKHDAFDADQLELILKSNSSVVETTDKEGKGTGEFKVVAKVSIDGKDLTLPIEEAVGKLRESGKYPNQFKVKGSPGTGLTLNNNPAAPGSDGTVPTDVAGFMKYYANAKATGSIR